MIAEGKSNGSTTCCLPLQHTIGKLAGFLCGSIDSKGIRTQPITLTRISLLLDTNPELINESLFSLMELGVIRLEHRRVVVRDRELLQNLVIYD